MEASKRLLINTVAQYLRTIINTLLSLYSTRLVLEMLGVSDYGIYNLVGSVVSMLSFVTSSMASTTQRFLSFNQREGNQKKLISIFSNCLIMHLILAVFVAVVLLSLIPVLFNGFLNIPFERVSAAKFVYIIVVVMLVVSFTTSPFRALLISRENIVYTSIVDVIDGVLKVVFVIILSHTSYDKLISFAIIALSIRSFNLLAQAIFDFIKYDECQWPRISSMNIKFCKEVADFAGWTLYGVVCLSGRMQGVAILLNKFMGTAINAAYGLGSQINSVIIFVCESLKSAIKPQTIKAEGEGNRDKMIMLAEIESKFSFFLLSFLAIPTIFEMPVLLGLWLKEVPDNVVLFARMFMLVSICDTITTGLGTANQAVGKIRMYNLIVFTTKLLTLPLIYLVVKYGFGMRAIAISFIIVELISSLLRIFVLHKQIKLNVLQYIKHVFLPIIIPSSICISLCVLLTSLFNFGFRFLLTFSAVAIVYIPVVYYLGLTTKERGIILHTFKRGKKASC